MYVIVTVNVEGPGAGDPGGFCEAGVLDWEGARLGNWAQMGKFRDFIYLF